MTRSPIDAYIAKAAPFARPILERLRRAFRRGCPALTETIKWGVPHFEYKGILGGMAAFKAHVSFGFWRGSQLADLKKLFPLRDRGPMGSPKYSDASQLPSEALLAAYVKRAAALNESGAPSPLAKRQRKPPPRTPPVLLAALRKNPKALAAYEAFPPSHKREYIDWICEAKQVETRDRRLATAVQWISQGKPRNWKYL